MASSKNLFGRPETHQFLELHDLETQRASIEIADEGTIKEYYDLRQQLTSYTKDVRDVINNPHYCLQFMQEGRLVRIKYKEFDFGWGAVIGYTPVKHGKEQNTEEIPPQDLYLVDVLLQVADSSLTGSRAFHALPSGIRPAVEGEKVKMEIVPILLSCVESIGHIRIFLPPDLKQADSRNTVRKSLEEVKRRFPDGIAVLDPIENMGITDSSFKKLLRVRLFYACQVYSNTDCEQKIEVLESRLLSNPLHNSPRLPELYEQYAGKTEVVERIRAVKKQITAALSIMQLDELKCRKRVLRRFGFINEAEVVQLKARVACEISTGDELLLSELLFDRFFNELSPELCASVLSCFIFEEKSDGPALRDVLAKPFREIQAKARMVAKVSQESKLQVVEDEYVQTFKHQLMEVVYAWAHGKSFAEIW